MFSYYLFFAASLMNILSDFSVSSCVTTCEDPPVFTPSRLVVKHGDPASASCSVCPSGCDESTSGLEHSVGDITRNGTLISWKINRMTEYGTDLMCYYTDDVSGDQCCTTLPLTLYKPPDSVSISVSNPTGLMSEGLQFTLMCSVHDVAPIQNLAVTFYRGNTQLGPPQSSRKTGTKPESETYTLTINATREDDGAQFWCEAQLELGPEGPQPPLVVKSENITTTVHYKPHLVSSQPKEISVTEGDSLLLNCSAVGNPPPTYTWTLPSPDSPSSLNTNVLSIKSVGQEHDGTITCSARNERGKVDVLFTVKVQVNYILYIIVAVLVAVILIASFAAGIYYKYYKNTKMGKYDMKNVFKLTKHLIPESNV